MSEPTSPTSALKLALLAKQARAQTGNIARAEPIAVVGLGCRFPGKADSPEKFWELLRAGVDAVAEIPPSRWRLDEHYDADPSTPGKSNIRDAALLEGIDAFDAAFFGILPREAERMDPQQRLFLEVAIDALDDSGFSRERLAGSRTGVYVASYHDDYTLMQYFDPEWIDPRTLTGMLHSVIANRLSYLLDLRGPSMALDSACSSSLVAVHLACQSLRVGETDLALAGGVSVIAAPDLMVPLSKVGFTSTRGRCRTFDAGADGFVRGEGCGAVVLKRLSDAVAAGDRILSVIRSSVVNQDGHSTVMTAPNGLAQREMVREALQNARIEPQRVGFVETHGTGTPLGDPIEVEALAETIGMPRADGSVCYLGAAKANVGHLEAAAGVLGLIKATLALRNGEIPPQVHLKQLNPYLSLERTCLRIPVELQAWPAGKLPRVAGVSSFGAGGTNAHVILEEAPALPAATTTPAGHAGPAGPWVLPLSAQSAAALRAVADRWIDYLPAGHASLGSLCTAAGERRSQYDFRLGVVGSTVGELQERLRAWLDNASSPNVVTGHRPPSGRPRLAFVFSGQGPQWFAMGRELAAGEPVFKQALVDIDAFIHRQVQWSLLDELAADEGASRLEATEFAQPAIFALQVALARLWKSWGVEPDGVVGHSIGELAALHVSGVLSLEEATRIVCQRGRAMQRAAGTGAMAAVSLSLHEAEVLVRRQGDELSIGAVNSPRGVVLSGSRQALAAALGELDARGVSHRALPVNYAFHSTQMQAIADEFATSLGAVASAPAQIPTYSTVTGEVADNVRFDAVYFGRNVRHTVRFASAIQAMLADGFTTFVEIGPHPVLGASIAECAAAQEEAVTLLASLRRGRPERETVLVAAAGVFASVCPPRWDLLNRAPAATVSLPSYPWQRQRYWIRERPAGRGSAVAQGMLASATSGPVVHELLGRRIPAAAVALYSATWPDLPAAWLRDHVISGRVLVPATGLLEALRAAAAAGTDGAQPLTIADFVIHHPLVLSEEEGLRTTWQVAAQTFPDGRLQVTLHEEVPSLVGGESEWRLIASAQAMRAIMDATVARAAAGTGLPASILEGDAQCDVIYAAFAALGLNFGPAFRTIRGFTLSGAGSVQGYVEGPQVSGANAGAHPTVLDGALQLCVTAASGGVPREALLPLGLDRYTVFAPVPARVRVHVTYERVRAGGALSANVSLHAPDGSTVALLEGIRFAPAADDWLYEVAWRAAAEPADEPAVEMVSGPSAWIILTDGRGVGDGLADMLESRGMPCLRLPPGEGEDLDSLLTRGDWRRGAPVGGIVHLWSLDSGASDSRISGAALRALQAMARTNALSARLILVTQGAQPGGSAIPRPAAAGLWGLASAVATELPDLDCRVIDLDPDAPGHEASALAAELLRTDTDRRRVLLRGTRKLLPALQRLRTIQQSAAPRRLLPGATGTLDSAQWHSATVSAPAAGEVRLKVLASGLNFRDVLLALGMYPNGTGIFMGSECAGVVESIGPDVVGFKSGDVVFGFASATLATEVTVPAAFLSRVPSALTPEQAAALPTAYLTGMFGLLHIAKLRGGQSVLIHAAAGGVGLAAVRLALRAGATVFATAGSPAKRELLRALGVPHVLDSRSLKFAAQIHELTGGAGVDVVLNSLTGDFIGASFSVLAQQGCFLELGKRDIWSDERARRERPDARYVPYDLGDAMRADHSLAASLMRDLVAALEAGELPPLPVRVFEFDAAREALRFMAQAKQVGKIVLRAPPAGGADAAPQPLAHAGASYLVTGAFGALGVRTARWLAEQGARHLVMVGRHLPNVAATSHIREIESLGAQVSVRTADVGDFRAMQAIFAEIRQSGIPLRGVIHAAGALADGVLLQQDWAKWSEALRGKAQGARVLDELTGSLGLDFFVLYSAAGLLLGPSGQGAYATANAELDAIAHSRRARGLPALSVAWGVWSEGGMATATSRTADIWGARGLKWITAAAGFARLERLLRDGVTHAAVLPIDWARFAANLPPGADRDYFRSLLPAGFVAARSAAEPRAAAPAVSRVTHWRAAPEAQRRSLVAAHVMEQALNVLGLPVQTILEPRAPLKEAGLDSLMAVELRNVLTRSVNQSLPATLLFDYPTIEALTKYLVEVLQLGAPAAALAADVEHPGRKSQAAARAAGASALASLSEEDAEAELLAELNGSSRGAV